MQWNSNALRSTLVLGAMAVLIFAPVMISGGFELNRARQAQVTEHHAAAYEAFSRAAQRLPWRADLCEQAGMEALKAKLPEETVRVLGQCKELSSAGLLSLGDAYLQTGYPELAMQVYQSALQQGASVELYGRLAALHRANGDLASERTALKNQLLLDPGNAAAQYRLGLLLSLSDINSAMTHLQLAAQQDQEYGPVWQTLRTALATAEMSPSEAGRLVTLGRAYGLVGEWSLARMAFQQAVEEDAQLAVAWAWLGETRQHLGEDASTEMDRALALDPSSVVVRGLRGLYWKRLRNEHKALEEYQAASLLEPQNPAWYASLGETQARLGDLVSALSSYQQASQLAASDSTYWRLLATFCLDYNVHVTDIGFPAAVKALERAPDDAMAMDVLGWAQFTLGDSRIAQTTLRQAIEAAPQYSLAHYHLAIAYLQTGDREAALEHINLAIQYDPGGPTGAVAQQLLEQQYP